MRTNKNKAVVFTLVIVILESLASCTMESDYITRLHEKITNDLNPPSAATYTVTYDGNGNEGGTAPVDENEYKEGEIFSVLGNSGSMEKIGLHFSGWNTMAAGSGSGYSSGESLIMGVENITLYAQWTTNTYILSLTASTGGSITQPGSSVLSVIHGVGTTITADADSGYTFSGWEVTGGSANIESVLSQSTTVILESGDAEITATFFDGTAPAPPAILGFDDGDITNENVIFSLAGFEPDYSKAEYSLDGGNNWETYSASVTILKEKDEEGDGGEGEYNIAARQFDKSNNPSLPADILAGIKTVTIDTTPPVAPVVNYLLTNDPTPTITWSRGVGSTGNEVYRVQRGTSGWSDNIVKPIELEYIEPTAQLSGSYTYFIQEQDEAGNWSDSGQNIVDIDRTPPNTPTVNCTSDSTDTTPTWTWSSNGGGGSGYTYKLDSDPPEDVPSSTTSFTPSPAISQGTHTLYVYEKDAAGNVSVAGQKSITISLPAPILASPADQADVAGLSTSLDWFDLSWASAYNLEEANDSSFSTSVENTETGTSSSTCSIGYQMAATVYRYWRVRGKNSDGSYGTWSDSRRIDFHPLQIP